MALAARGPLAAAVGVPVRVAVAVLAAAARQAEWPRWPQDCRAQAAVVVAFLALGMPLALAAWGYRECPQTPLLLAALAEWPPEPDAPLRA